MCKISLEISLENENILIKKNRDNKDVLFETFLCGLYVLLTGFVLPGRTDYVNIR